MDHADPLAEFVERVRNVYLPTYVANLDRRYIGRVVPGLPLSFNPDEIKTSAETAAGFLRAVDEGPVERRPTSFSLPKDRPKGRCALFDRPTSKGRLPFLNEGPIDVAAAGLLALDLGWPEERLGFRTRPEYFDISAYGPQDDPMTKDHLVIAGETNWKQSEVDELVEDIPNAARYARQGEVQRHAETPKRQPPQQVQGADEAAPSVPVAHRSGRASRVPARVQGLEAGGARSRTRGRTAMRCRCGHAGGDRSGVGTALKSA